MPIARAYAYMYMYTYMSINVYVPEFRFEMLVAFDEYVIIMILKYLNFYLQHFLSQRI